MEELIAKYLADEMGAEERSKFEEQLLLDEQLSNEVQKTIAAWEISGRTNQPSLNLNTPQAWEKVAQQTTKQRSLVAEKGRFSFLKIAASIVFIAALGYIGWQNIAQKTTAEQLATVASSGEIKELTLPDGTSVKLNAFSTVTYDEDFGKTNRNISLTGAANFDVVRNESLPFVISTENSEVEVLGTSFEVRAYEAEAVEVNISSGKVGFRSKKAKGEEQVLEAGEKAVLSADGTKMVRDKVRNKNYAAWWTRELIFENARMSEVARDLEKTYWVKIEVAEDIRDCRISQNVKDKSLDEALEILEATFPSMTISRVKENRIKLDGVGCTH